MGATPTDTMLARELHQAALDVIAARQRGDATAEAAARARLERLSAAYRNAGHTQDELEAAKAGSGPLQQLADVLRNTALLIVVVALALLWILRKG